MKKLIVTLTLPLALACFAFGADKPWQTGSVKFAHFQGSRTFTTPLTTPGTAYSTTRLNGNTATTYTNVTPAQTYMIPTRISWFVYGIQAGDRFYISQEKCVRRQRPALLLVGGDVRFYIEKDKLFLQDEANKTHKTFMLRIQKVDETAPK